VTTHLSGLCIVCRDQPIEPNRTSYCRKCRRATDRERWMSKSEDARQSKWLKYKYGLTLEEYRAMYDRQEGKCATCKCEIDITLSKSVGQGRSKAVVDHCHETSKVRGLLCNHCNRALGLIFDSVETLIEMASYVRKSNA